MKRAPEGLGPIVALDRKLARPLHGQLYDGYRQAILDGRLRRGQRLPSTRTLAQELGVSRLPVVTAFEQLVAEGYVESRVGAGSFVSTTLPDPRPVHARGAAVTSSHRPGVRRVPPSPLAITREPWFELGGAFRIGAPAIDAFPIDIWTRLMTRHARLLSRRHMTYRSDPMGLPSLREAIASYLRTVRSVSCTPEQIMIVSGSQQALALTWRALLAPGDAVWLEEPGYGGARDAIRLARGRVVGVPVDRDGLDTTAGIARAPSARAAYVTPSHQYPLGVIMSAPRRLQLLAWAQRRGAWIVEDDYDSEYRYDTQPIASLHGLDRDARVIYVGTFSKSLFPALRVGYLVIPRDLVARFRRFRDALDIFPAPLYQGVLDELFREGHFARHLRRMRGVYAERRLALERTLAAELGEMCPVVGDRAGMHLVIMLPPHLRDHDVAVRAAQGGISVIPLSSFYTNAQRRRPGLVLGYGATRLDDIPDAVRRLSAVIRGRR